jgi:hypothetical protein
MNEPLLLNYLNNRESTKIWQKLCHCKKNSFDNQEKLQNHLNLLFL